MEYFKALRELYLMRKTYATFFSVTNKLTLKKCYNNRKNHYPIKLVDLIY